MFNFNSVEIYPVRFLSKASVCVLFCILASSNTAACFFVAKSFLMVCCAVLCYSVFFYFNFCNQINKHFKQMSVRFISFNQLTSQSASQPASQPAPHMPQLTKAVLFTIICSFIYSFIHLFECFFFVFLERKMMKKNIR